MTLGYGILLLLLGSVASIALFVLMIRFEESIEKDKKEDKK
jgi:hypothetical protein